MLSVEKKRNKRKSMYIYIYIFHCHEKRYSFRILINYNRRFIILFRNFIYIMTFFLLKEKNSLIKSSNSKNSIEYCVIRSRIVHSCLFVCYINLGMIYDYRISPNKLDLDYIELYGNNHTYQ